VDEVMATGGGEGVRPEAVGAGGEAAPFGFESGRGTGHDYVPEWMAIPGAGETEGEGNPYAVVKFFTPDAGWTWFVMECQPPHG
jgi:hypothetical protein